MANSHRLKPWFGIVLMILMSLACSLSAAQPQNQPGLDQTSIAIGVQQTSIALEKATLLAEKGVTATLPPTEKPAPSTHTPLPSDTALPTQIPVPSDTPLPTQAAPTATARVEAPTATPTSIDIQAKIKGANVLVYEDMAGYFERKALVHQAVDEMNFSGGKVIEVNDALGKFKEQLLSPTKWDLIIVAAEYRTSVQGEFWKYVYDQLNKKVALVIEVWYLDQHYSDIQPIFNQCGIAYQKDWPRNSKYNLLDYSIYWLQPDHPFFQPPQEPVSLANPSYLYWVPPLTSDAGDLLTLGTGGDAVLLAGTQPSTKSQYGVLAVCMKGTVMVQTYSSHDYDENEVVKMWKNYMRYTLTNHFQTGEK